MHEYTGIAINVVGWVFMAGLTVGYTRTALGNLDKRLSRIEDWIFDKHTNGHGK